MDSVFTVQEFTRKGAGYGLSETTQARINQAEDGEMILLSGKFSEEQEKSIRLEENPYGVDTIAQARTKLAKVRDAIKAGRVNPVDRASLKRGETALARLIWDSLIAEQDREMSRMASALENFKAGWVYTIGKRFSADGVSASAGKFSVEKGDPYLGFIVKATKLHDDASMLDAALASDETLAKGTVRKPETKASEAIANASK